MQTSRYRSRPANSRPSTFLTQEQVKNMPRLADETLRAVQRLPGTATNGFSSIGSVRGGEPNETAIVLDGLRLYEPFHLKNFLSPVSLLDSRLIDGIEFYSGGFPVIYGDRMSAIIDARPRAARAAALLRARPEPVPRQRARVDAVRGRPRPRAASPPAAATSASSRACSENDFGKPQYSDGFGALDYAVRRRDARRASTSLRVERSRSRRSRTPGEQTRAREVSQRVRVGDAGSRLVAAASSRVIASFTDLVNERNGEVDEPGARIGSVSDEPHAFTSSGCAWRTARRGPARTSLRRRSAASVGRLRLRERRARSSPAFRFRARRARETARRRFSPSPTASRRRLTGTAHHARASAGRSQGGMRVDTQTYDGSDDGEQWSPRLSVLYDAGAARHACARAGAGSSSRRASTSCRSRMASTRSIRRSMPITRS